MESIEASQVLTCIPDQLSETEELLIAQAMIKSRNTHIRAYQSILDGETQLPEPQQVYAPGEKLDSAILLTDCDNPHPLLLRIADFLNQTLNKAFATMWHEQHNWKSPRWRTVSHRQPVSYAEILTHLHILWTTNSTYSPSSLHHMCIATFPQLARDATPLQNSTDFL